MLKKAFFLKFPPAAGNPPAETSASGHQIKKNSGQKPAINQFCPDFALIFKEKHALICKLQLLVTQVVTIKNIHDVLSSVGIFLIKTRAETGLIF